MSCMERTERDVKPIQALIVNDDLFSSVRIENGLRNMGYEVRVVTTANGALDAATSQGLKVVILNMAGAGFSGLDVAAGIKALAGSIRILGFAPHKELPLIRDEAGKAGIDLLVANSALAARLPQLVSKLIGASAGAD